jgi:hypothetical protein
MSGLSKEIQETIDLMIDYDGDRKEIIKKKKQTLYYQLTKEGRRFNATGASNGLARIGSELCHWASVAPAEREGRVIPIFPGGEDKPDFSTPLLIQMASCDPKLKAVLDCLVVGIGAKAEELEKKMRNPEFKSVRGLYSMVEADAVDLEQVKIAIAALDDYIEAPILAGPAQLPYALTCRKYTLRHGVSCYPSPGIGNFIIAIGAPLYVAAIPIGILSAEAGLLHMEQLMQCLEKKDMRAKEYPYCIVGVGECFWCPYGYTPLVCASKEIATAGVVPWYSKAMADEVPCDVWDIITSAIQSFGNKTPEKLPWKVTLPFLKGFMKR